MQHKCPKFPTAHIHIQRLLSLSLSISILKIIISRGPLIFRHTLLLLIQLHHHPTRCRLLRFLILPLLDKSREPETYSLSPTPTPGVARVIIAQDIAAGLVARTQGQVGGFDFPDEAGFEPDVWLVFRDGGVSVEGFGAVDDCVAELGVEVFEEGFGEAGADVADCFVGLAGGVVAGEEEGAVDRGSFAFAEVGAENDEVEGVADAG